MSFELQDQLSTGRKPELDGQGLRVAIACGRFNDVITDRLLQGARSKLAELRVVEADVTEVWAPGAFELPLVAKTLAASGRYDAVVTLGAVIRGGTPISSTWRGSAPPACSASGSTQASPSSSGCSPSSRPRSAPSRVRATRAPSRPRPPSRWPTWSAPSAEIWTPTPWDP